MDSSLAAADHREVCTISKYQEFDAQIFEATKIMIGFTLSEGQKAELLKIAGEICSSPFYFALFLPLILDAAESRIVAANPDSEQRCGFQPHMAFSREGPSAHDFQPYR